VVLSKKSEVLSLENGDNQFDKNQYRNLYMPFLDRTILQTSDKLDFLLKAAACQAHGDISSFSDEFDVSRKTVRKAKVVGLHLI
jgi:hypothetical protein